MPRDTKQWVANVRCRLLARDRISVSFSADAYDAGHLADGIEVRPMAFLPLNRYRIGLLTTAALAVAGCNALMSTVDTTPTAMPQHVQDLFVNSGAAARGTDTKRGALLYVSDEQPNESGRIYVYSYPALKLLETLKGHEEPTGACVDLHDDVYVVSANFAVEYSHGRKKPLRTIVNHSTGRNYFVSCAVDRGTGDLALVERNEVAIYRGGTGSPIAYSHISKIYYPSSSTFDSEGNLYVLGAAYVSEEVALERLSAGHTRFTPIQISDGQDINPFGGMQSYEGSIVMTSESAALRYVIKGRRAVYKSTTPLGGADDIDFYVFNGGKLIAPSVYTGPVNVYKYPSGREVTSLGGFNEPIAVAVSP